jgi:bacterioferritin (cytochrome b1)
MLKNWNLLNVWNGWTQLDLKPDTAWVGILKVLNALNEAQRLNGLNDWNLRINTVPKMVTEDLMLEKQQIEVYPALIREIGDQDSVARQVILSLLVETEKHASELADYLKRSPNQ